MMQSKGRVTAAVAVSLLLYSCQGLPFDSDSLGVKLPDSLGKAKLNFSSVDFKLPDLFPFGASLDDKTGADLKSCLLFPCPSSEVPVLDAAYAKCPLKDAEGCEEKCCRWWITVIEAANATQNFGFQNIKTNGVGGWVTRVNDNDGPSSELVGNAERSFDFETLAFFPTTIGSGGFDIANDGTTVFIGVASPYPVIVNGQQILSTEGEKVGGFNISRLDDAQITNDAKCVLLSATNTEGQVFIEKISLPGGSRETLLGFGDVIEGEELNGLDGDLAPSGNGKKWLVTNFNETNIDDPGWVIVKTDQLLRLGGAVVRGGDPVPPSLGLNIPGAPLTWGQPEQGPTKFQDINNKGDTIIQTNVNNGTLPELEGDRLVILVNEEAVFEEGVTCFEDVQSPLVKCPATPEIGGASTVGINDKGDYFYRVNFEFPAPDLLVLNGKVIAEAGTEIDVDGDGQPDFTIQNSGDDGGVDSRGAISERFKDGTVDVFNQIDLCPLGQPDCSGEEEMDVIIAFTVQVDDKKKKKDDILEAKQFFDFDVEKLGLKDLTAGGKFDLSDFPFKG